MVLFSRAPIESQEEWIHSLSQLTKQAPKAQGEDMCQSFNNQLSIPPSLESPLLHLGHTPVQLKCQFCLTELEFSQGLPFPSFLLPFSPAQILNISCLTPGFLISVSTVLSQREKSNSWKTACPQSGREKKVIRHNCLTKCIYEHHWTKCLPVTAAIAT